MANSILITDLGGQIPYAEYAHETQALSYIGKRFRAQRVFTEIPWLSHYDFAANVIGYPQLRVQGGVQYIHRVIPRPYPILSVVLGSRFLYARELLRTEGFYPKTEGMDAGGSFGVYDTARLTIGYDTVPFKILPDAAIFGTGAYSGIPDESRLLRYITRHLLPSGEYLQLPQGAHRWVSDETKAPQSLGRALNRVDLTYTWHEVPGIPTSIYTAVGRVNETEFDGFAAQKLYLVAVEAIPYKSMAGTTVYDITFRMRWCGEEQPTHNHFLRFRGQALETAWDIPVSGLIAAPRRVFLTYEFDNLFRGPFGFTAS